MGLRKSSPGTPPQPEHVDDDDLLRRIRASDQNAFDSLYLSSFADLWRVAYRLVGDNDAANDIVQDVFVSLWLNRTTWTVRTTVWAYLYGAVRNKTTLHYRSRYRYRQAMQRVSNAVALGEDSAGIGDIPESPYEQTIRGESARTLQAAVRSLPERQRLAMSLWWEDLTPDEIADVMGVTVVAVRKLLAKGNRRLAEALNLSR